MNVRFGVLEVGLEGRRLLKKGMPVTLREQSFQVLAALMERPGEIVYARRRWGWQLAVAIIATQVLGTLVNIFMADLLRGGIGFLIAGALLFYLLRLRLQSAFASGESSKGN
jgi:hypothetical protein